MNFSSMAKPSSSIFCFSILLVCCAALQNPVSALEECDFPAIFNFGDSNSDTGGLAAAFNWTPPPNGETFFQVPAGRNSDGRLVIDFIARSLGLPFISAYLNSLGTNFSHGANFATASATIAPPETVLPVGGYSPFDLDVQYWQFVQFINRSQAIRKGGGIYGDLMPKEEYFSKALYTFDMGQNDLGQAFASNMSIEEVKASVPEIVDIFTTTVKKIYSLGARSFWIHNTGPIGCLPYILEFLPVPADQIDNAGCGRPYNDVAQYFNYKLKEAIAQLRKDIPSAAITYVDVYSVKYSLFVEPKKYGFELPQIACCGFGGRYNFGNVRCGSTITFDNGTEIFVGSCARPWTRVNWDGVHYTDAANKFVFDQISDPLTTLRMACHKI